MDRPPKTSYGTCVLRAAPSNVGQKAFRVVKKLRRAFGSVKTGVFIVRVDEFWAEAVAGRRQIAKKQPRYWPVAQQTPNRVGWMNWHVTSDIAHFRQLSDVIEAGHRDVLSIRCRVPCPRVFDRLDQ